MTLHVILLMPTFFFPPFCYSPSTAFITASCLYDFGNCRHTFYIESINNTQVISFSRSCRSIAIATTSTSPWIIAGSLVGAIILGSL